MTMQKSNLFNGEDAARKSRQLINKNGQKVLLLRFSRGDQMAPHSAPVDVLALVLEGKLDITLAGERAEFERGDYVIFPAGATHALHCLEDASLLLFK
jgi:quercetin dioxygenase-like cupin family protein